MQATWAMRAAIKKYSLSVVYGGTIIAFRYFELAQFCASNQ